MSIITALIIVFIALFGAILLLLYDLYKANKALNNLANKAIEDQKKAIYGNSLPPKQIRKKKCCFLKKTSS